MGKKFMNTVLFLAVTVAAATLTAYVGKGSGNVLLYNFTFLGLMLIIYAVGLFAGLYRMDNLSRALKHGACLLYTSPSPRDPKTSRMPSSA